MWEHRLVGAFFFGGMFLDISKIFQDWPWRTGWRIHSFYVFFFYYMWDEDPTMANIF